MISSYHLCCHGAGMQPTAFNHISQSQSLAPHMDILLNDEAIPRTMPDSMLVQPDNKVNLLTLPLEIRLHIYHWLHLMCPVRHAQLAPWYPTPVHCQYILKLVEPETSSENAISKQADQGLLSSHRPLSGLPTYLLQTCHQIYREARLVPFEQNEFRFGLTPRPFWYMEPMSNCALLFPSLASLSFSLKRVCQTSLPAVAA